MCDDMFDPETEAQLASKMCGLTRAFPGGKVWVKLDEVLTLLEEYGVSKITPDEHLKLECLECGEKTEFYYCKKCHHAQF